MPMEESAAGSRAAPASAARSAGATPMPRSPKLASKQSSVPVSSANTAPSSLPKMKILTLKCDRRRKVQQLCQLFSRRKTISAMWQKVVKDRLAKRDFNHMRHDPYYNDLTKPETPESLSYADHHRKEFWRTDVERVVKREEEQRRARRKALIAIWASEESWRRHCATKMRDMRCNAYLDMNERVEKVSCRNNMSGAPHINIITRQATGEDGEPIDEGPIHQDLDDVAK